MLRLLVRCQMLLLVPLLLCLAGCGRSATAPGDPVAAVKGMAAALRDNDLVRFSQLSVPPALHRRMEARWSARIAAAAPPSAVEVRDYDRWLARLTGSDAQERLYRRWDAKLKKIEPELHSQWPLMQTTAGIFINGYVQSMDSLGADQKIHAKAIGAAVLAWLTPGLVADRARARKAIAVITQTAKVVDLPTFESMRQLQMIPALRKGGQVLKGFKQLGRLYGVDIDVSLSAVQARVVEAQGNNARLQVSYPLLGQTVQFDMDLLRRDGRWYSADAVHKAEADLAQPISSAASAS